MSAFEQKKEAPDPNFQYVLFAAEPYLTIGFKIPNKEIERDVSSGKLHYHWDKDQKVFTLQIYFKEIPAKEPTFKPTTEINNSNLTTSAADVD